MDDRRAGRSTRDLAAKRRKANIQILVVGFLALVVLLVAILDSEALGIGSGGVVLLVAAAWFIKWQVEAESRKIEKMERRAVRGAEAEEQRTENCADRHEKGADHQRVHARLQKGLAQPRGPQDDPGRAQ